MYIVDILNLDVYDFYQACWYVTSDFKCTKNNLLLNENNLLLNVTVNLMS